ncbi:transposase [Streptomyces albidoflavus]|nr:transposase [Streptomyces albidoflavus]WJK69877.1 transposase [Streptomyces albidoflavus]
MIVDRHGTPLAVTLTGGNRHDVTQLLPLLDAVPPIRGLRGRPRRKPASASAGRGPTDPGSARTPPPKTPASVCRPGLRLRQVPPPAVEARRLYADRGYDFDRYRRLLWKRGVKKPSHLGDSVFCESWWGSLSGWPSPASPAPSSATADSPNEMTSKPVIARRGVAHGSGLGKVRWVVERAFAWLHQFKRLRIRYERRADLHQGLLELACSLICLRRLRTSF